MDFSRGDTPLMFAFSMLSILSITAMILSFAIFRHVRRKEYMRVVLYLAISNLLNNIGSLPGLPVDGSFACWFEALMTNIFTLSSLAWSVVITFMIHRIVFTGKIPVIDWKYHVICWGFPILVTILALINTTYGAPSGMGWCWVVPTAKTPPWALLFWYWETFYIWITAGVFAMMVMCVHVVYYIKNVHASTQDALMKVVSSAQYYPVIIAVCWGGQLVYDNVSYYTSFPGIEQVNAFSLTIACAQGFFTAVLFFVSNKDIRNCWYILLTAGKYDDPAEQARRRWSSAFTSAAEELKTKKATREKPAEKKPIVKVVGNDKVQPIIDIFTEDGKMQETGPPSESTDRPGKLTRLSATKGALARNTSESQSAVVVTVPDIEDVNSKPDSRVGLKIQDEKHEDQYSGHREDPLFTVTSKAFARRAVSYREADSNWGPSTDTSTTCTAEYDPNVGTLSSSGSAAGTPGTPGTHGLVLQQGYDLFS